MIFRSVWVPSVLIRSAFAIGTLAALAALTDSANAQGYSPPPYGAQQSYPGAYRPVPAMPVPDDDDDDIPASQRATGNIPPPPGGYRGPFANDPRQAPVDQGALPPPGPYGAAPPAYGQPTVVYGNRDPNMPAYAPPPGGGHGQPESYGAPPAYPNQAALPPPQPYGQQPVEPYQQGPAQGAPIPPATMRRDSAGTPRPNTVATLPPEEQPDDGKPELAPQFKRQIVPFQTTEPAGTIVIDTANTFLYLVLGNGQAMRYGVGVGREGFTWAGTERVTRMKEWPDWYPPAEMIERQPYLPRMMAGGETNPLGARALYLGKTVYRIHGTNQPSTIGKYVSSGCIRLTNEDIADLYSRVQVGTRVVVMPGSAPATAQNNAPQPIQQR
jgi:lipoprotein-anchoring transpeptidase ErfK/SrfK